MVLSYKLSATTEIFHPMFLSIFRSQDWNLAASVFRFHADQNSDRKIPFTAKVNIPAVACDDGAFAFYVKWFGSYKKALLKKNKNLSEKKKCFNAVTVVPGRCLRRRFWFLNVVKWREGC
jgi:hypothetical protein